MTEAIVVVALAALGLALLTLGVLELIWPSQPRRRRRASAPGTERRLAPAATGAAREPGRPIERAAPADAPTEGAASEPPIERLLRAQAEPAARRASARERSAPSGPGDRAAPAEAPPADGTPAARAEPPATRGGAPGARAPADPAPTPVAPSVAPDREALSRGAGPAEPAEPPAEGTVGRDAGEPGPSTAVERVTRRWEEGRFSEVVREGTELLAGDGVGPAERARLWGLVGLARQALGEPEGARAAFEEAMAAAPAADRPGWARYLASLALGMGQALLERAAGDAEPETRVATVRAAIQWLEDGLAASPDDADLREALDGARAALWDAYEQAATALTQRQAHAEARHLLREALADERCPPARQAAFRERLAAAASAEIGQLTADAIRRMQEGHEAEALAALARAEALFAQAPADGLPARRRQELERRLWWGYTKLGIRRVDAERWEEALEPLLHALGFEGVGPERHDETRRPLVRALEGLVDARAALVRRLLDEGQHDEAAAHVDRLDTALRAALDRGVRREDLGRAFGRAQPLFERLGRRPPA